MTTQAMKAQAALDQEQAVLRDWYKHASDGEVGRLAAACDMLKDQDHNPVAQMVGRFAALALWNLALEAQP